jgi:hypothetical protein
MSTIAVLQSALNLYFVSMIAVLQSALNLYFMSMIAVLQSALNLYFMSMSAVLQSVLNCKILLSYYCMDESLLFSVCRQNVFFHINDKTQEYRKKSISLLDVTYKLNHKSSIGYATDRNKIHMLN